MHLTEDNLCSIYETRPVVCNVEKTYEVYFSRVMSKQEFEQMNRKICITLQEK
jgi:Fe-S-cluster containining protein